MISYTIVFHHKSSKKFVNEHPVKCSSDYFDLLFDFTCSTATCQLDDILIIYILSTAHNFDRRNVIRSTWGSPFLGTCFVFILGKSQSPIQQRIEQEKRKYKDIVQIDHVESYGNVVYKEVGALHWSSHFYPSIPFLFKTDDDLIVDTLLISSIAQILTSNNQRNSSYIAKYSSTLIVQLLAMNHSTLFLGGWTHSRDELTLPNGTYTISRNFSPRSILQPFCTGLGWLMSKDVRNRLVETSKNYLRTKTAQSDNFFLSEFLAKEAKVKCTGIAIDFDETSSGKCACLMTQRPMLTVCTSTLHGHDEGNETEKLSEYKTAWKVIRNRHNNKLTAIENC